MIGETVSHYRVLSRLGEGGMGAVYLAEDTRRARQVALKILRPEVLGGAEARERLQREALACVALHHPNITDVYEVGESRGRCFIAMELIDGETLREMRSRGAVPWARLAEIGRQVASAIGRAHRQGLVHRDLKSDNVMVDRAGRVKVLDFGLALDVHPGSADPGGERVTQAGRDTRPGEILGTIEYMSPEQAQGREAGPASDTFSLGVVLYELAAGQLPFRGASAPAILHALVYDDPEPLRALRPDTPPGLERLLRRALQKRIDRRFPNGAAMEAELEALARELPPDSGEPPAARPRRDAVVMAPRVTHSERLVGRQAEMDLLREMLRGVESGSGRATWIAGEAGCGKSRLLAELRAHADRSGALVLHGACRVREGTRPYHPFAEALGGAIRRAGGERAADLVPYLERLEPGLGRWAGVLASLVQLDARGAEAPASREQVLDAVAALLAALSRSAPVLLEIDDLHWADPETLDLTHQVLRMLPRRRMLVVGTYRPEDLGPEGEVHPLRSFLERADREAPGARVALRRLDREQTAELVEEILGGTPCAPRFLEDVHGRTEGNPLFVIELVQMLRAEGALARDAGGRLRALPEEVAAVPGRIRDIIARRVQRLGPIRQRILEVAAAEGATFHSGTVTACLGLDRLEVLSQLQSLERDLQLVHAEGDAYRFDHGLIRDALVEGMIPELRREYHRRIGQHLIREHGHRQEAAAAIAYQLQSADDPQGALPYLLEAARAAARVFSNERAIELYDQAERVLRRQGAGHSDRDAMRMKVWERRGELLQTVGRFDQAIADFRRLEERAAAASDPVRQAMAQNRIGEVLGQRGDYDGALREVERASAAARRAGDDRARADAEGIAGQVHYHRGEYDLALAAHERSLTLRHQIGDHAGVAHTLNKIGNIRYYRSEYEAAAAAYQAALEMERDQNDRRGMAESLMNLGAVHLQLGDETASLEHHRAALAIKRETGDRRSLSMSLNNLALVLEAMGRLDEARAHHEESLVIKREIGDARGISTSLYNLSLLAERGGLFETALRTAEESLVIKREIRDDMSVPYALNAIGAALAALGRPTEAEEHHREALRLTRISGDRTEESHSLRRIGEARLARGDAAGARGPLAESLSVAREVGVHEGEMEALYALGRAQVAGGRLGSAGVTAAALREGAGRSPEFRAKAADLSGRLAEAEGRAEDACGQYEEALSAAAEVGMRDLQWRLHAALARTRPGGPDGPEGSAERARAQLILDDLAARITDAEARAGFLARPAARDITG